jgi:hypothetical protein
MKARAVLEGDTSLVATLKRRMKEQGLRGVQWMISL